MNTRQNIVSKNKQTGVALVVSMLVLLVMTMIGLAAMRTTTLQEKMAGNMHDKALSFQAAEAALRTGENTLTAANMDNDEMFNCVYGGIFDTIDCYELTDSVSHASTATVWSSVDTTNYNIVGGQQAPQFFIEFVDKQPWGHENPSMNEKSSGGSGGGIGGQDIYYFRVTARGTGGSANAQTVLRTYFGRQ